MYHENYRFHGRFSGFHLSLGRSGARSKNENLKQLSKTCPEESNYPWKTKYDPEKGPSRKSRSDPVLWGGGVKKKRSQL